MRAVLFIMFWVATFGSVVALVIAHVMRRADDREACGGQHGHDEVHGRGAEGEVVIETGELEDMLDAIVEHRRRAGRRDIGEQLAEVLLRSTGHDSPPGARRASARRRAPARCGTFILCHEHRPEECRIAIAAWKGYRSPLRGGRPLGSCASGGHRLWWTVQAADGAAALAQLPGYVADRTIAQEVREVPLP
jgi:hypothetical protein